MKKLSFIFSWLLLSLIGATGAYAQWSTGLDPLTEVTPGQRVVLQNAQTSHGYLCGDAMSEQITEDCIYTFETAGTDGGFTTYYLKQESTGLYLKNQILYGWNDSSDLAGFVTPYVWYTSDPSEAFVCTVLPANSTGDWRSQTNAEQGMVITSTYTYVEGGETVPTYLGDETNPFLSPWPDTNAWYVYELVELSGSAMLQSFIDGLYPNGLDNSYSVGSNPGQVQQSAIEEMRAAITAAEEACSRNLSQEEAQAEIDKLNAAKEKLEASANPMTDGYYYIVDNRGGNNTVYDNGTGLAFTNGYVIPGLDGNLEGKYMWQVTATGNGNFTLLNHSTGSYVSSQWTTINNQNAHTQFLTGTAAESWTIALQPATPGTFNIYSPTDNSLAWNTDGVTATVGKWSDLTDAGNCFQFIAVDPAVLDQIAESIAQERLNNQLSAVANNAQSALLSSRYFDSDAPTTAQYDDPGLLVDASQLGSNATCATEGSIDALVDGDVLTYFHSEWAASLAPDEDHYLQIDLGEPLQNIAFQYVERKGQHAQGSPKEVTFQVADTPDGPYTDAVKGTLTYNYPVTWPDDEATLNNAIGIYVLQLPKAAQYIRMVVNSTIANGQANGHPFFYFSEFHAYPATYNATTSPYEQVSASVRTEFETQLAAAQAELAEGKATAETLASLQAAYDAFLAECPMPATLRAAIEEAKSATEGLVEGTEPGYFAEGSIATFNSAVAEVEASLEGVATIETINSGLAKLEAATTALNNALIMPKTGQLYSITSMTSDEVSKGLNSMVYAQSNALNTLKWGGYDWDNQVETAFPSMQLEYLWYIENVFEDGTVSLRNVGTGFYMGNQNTLNQGVALSETPCHIGLRSARVGGGFNLIVGNGMYANVQGSSYNLVGWSTAEGTDNSAFRFEERSMEEAGMVMRSVTANRLQVITLPYAITTGLDGSKIYSVIGQNAGKLVLEDRTNGQEIAAGEPFVYMPADGVGEADNPYEIFILAQPGQVPAFASKGGSVNGLVGTLTGTAAGEIGAGCGLFGVAGITLSAENSTVAANSGWLSYAIPETTEAGDLQVDLPEGGITSIDGIDLAKDAQVDVYTLSGVKVRSNIQRSAATQNLPAGIYIVGGKKVLVK